MSTFSAIELAAWCDGAWEPCAPPLVGGITNSTLRLVPGDLYVALKGARHDGQAFVADAFQRGASGAIVRQDAPGQGSDRRPLLRVPDPLTALQHMAAAYRRKVAPRVIGITGSVGKTSVKELTAQVLSAQWHTACTQGNWNNDIGLPLSLLHMDARAAFGVFELGVNHPGEMAPLVRILQPEWGVVTNVGRAHIEFFGTEAGIAAEKAVLLAALPPSGRAFLDRNGAHFDALLRCTAAPVTTVAMTGAADYVCLRYAPAADAPAVVQERATGDTLTFRPIQPGAFMVHNCLFAIAIARAAGLAWSAIAAALEQFKPLPLRWQQSRWCDVLVINDAYNANPTSMRAALDAFAAVHVEGRKWLVLGGMLELGDQATVEHRALGAHLAGGSWDGVLTVGDLARGVADGAVQAGFPAARVLTCPSNAAAGEALAIALRAGDAVLLKGSRGFRLEEVVQHLHAKTEG